jgi:hypothetical protein
MCERRHTKGIYTYHSLLSILISNSTSFQALLLSSHWTSISIFKTSIPLPKMFFSITILSVAFLASLSAAAPATLEERQGGSFVSVGVKYSGPGCNPADTPLGDPIFGNGNVCQPLDRFGDGAPIVSYQTLSVSAGCSGKYQLFFVIHVKLSVREVENLREYVANICGSDHLHRRELHWHCVFGSSGWMCDR